MKNKVLIYILTFSMIFMTGCSNSSKVDDKKEEKSIDTSIEKDKLEDKNIDGKVKDTETKNTDLENEIDERKAVMPIHAGVKFDIDLDSYKSILPLTEDWEFYHDAEKHLKKKLLTIDGEMFDDSVLFFECGNEYVAIASDRNDYSSTFIAIIGQTDDAFDVKFVERYKYSFNSAKEEVLLKDDEIILMTQFPFSAYSLFGKFIHEGDNIIYNSLVDYDSSVAYYTEFMELLNEGAMKKAMELEDYSSYPFSYETLYFKSGNLAIKKSLEFAKVSLEKNDEEKAKELLEWGLALYLEKHYNYTFDKDEIEFDNVYIKKDNDFGLEFILPNEFMFDYLDFYLSIYSEIEDEEKTEILIAKIEEFKAKLTEELNI